MLRYLSAVDLRRAWVALDGDADAADLDVLEEVVSEASPAALHALAAAMLVAIARRRPFGDRSDYMALVVADLAYQVNGWALPGDRSEAFDELVQRVTTESLSIAEVAETLARLAEAVVTPSA